MSLIAFQTYEDLIPKQSMVILEKNGGFMLYNKIYENFQSLHLSEPIY